MSFLLDALRKSERVGQRREVPGINSPAPASASTQHDLEWLPPVLLLVPAFLTMLWLGLEQYGLGTEPARPPAAPVDRGDDSVAAVESARPRAASPSQQEGGSDPVTEVGGGPVRGRRTPVEQPPASAPSRETTRAAATSSAQSPAPKGVPLQDSPTPAPVRSESQRRGAAAPATPAPRQNHIDFWDLPAGVRDQLPEFRINVLVYADDPAERFILINGRRQHEGDALQQGLVLQEIRRDGVIYSFRRYRFLVRQ